MIGADKYDKLIELCNVRDVLESAFAAHLAHYFSDMQVLKSFSTEDINNGSKPVVVVSISEGGGYNNTDKVAAFSEHPEESAFEATLSVAIATPLKLGANQNNYVARLRAAMLRGVLFNSELFDVATKGIQLSYPIFGGRADSPLDGGYESALSWSFRYFYTPTYWSGVN